MKRYSILALLLLALFCLPIRPASTQDTQVVGGELNEDEKIYHLLSRLSPGPTPELIAEVKEVGIDAWLDKQISGEVKEGTDLTSRIQDLDTLGMSIHDLMEKYNKPIPDGAPQKERREIQQNRQVPKRQTLSWVLNRAVYSNQHVREAMADFYRNHFSVSVDKDAVRYYVVDWEREIIHGMTFEPFGDILKATSKHSAMLFYLDNHLSRRPASKQELFDIKRRVRNRTRDKSKAEDAVDIAKQLGLNENYARELLELHTLGVDNYYSQRDVINVAKCLTGWSIERRNKDPYERGTFLFLPKMHSDGHKPFLNALIKEDKKNPLREGEVVLEILERHEGTSEFLSWKLCRWLINDHPDEEMVGRIAKKFQKTRGDGTLLKEIVNDKDFFSRKNYRSKFKRPYEFVISALRATHAEVNDINGIIGALNSMNESLYRCIDPTGYYDQAEAWQDPGAMAVRWTFASELATGKIKGVRIPASLYADLDPKDPDSWVDAMTRKILPVVGVDTETERRLKALVEKHIASMKKVKPTPQNVGPIIAILLLGSPEFQRQ